MEWVAWIYFCYLIMYFLVVTGASYDNKQMYVQTNSGTDDGLERCHRQSEGSKKAIKDDTHPCHLGRNIRVKPISPEPDDVLEQS